ncbi:hypothetical protein ACHAWF_010469 [Thalassiosira exigua]
MHPPAQNFPSHRPSPGASTSTSRGGGADSSSSSSPGPSPGGRAVVCGMRHAHPATGRTGSYTGQVDPDTGLPHGLGTLRHADGAMAEGEWRDGTLVRDEGARNSTTGGGHRGRGAGGRRPSVEHTTDAPPDPRRDARSKSRDGRRSKSQDKRRDKSRDGRRRPALERRGSQNRVSFVDDDGDDHFDDNNSRGSRSSWPLNSIGNPSPQHLRANPPPPPPQRDRRRESGRREQRQQQQQQPQHHQQPRQRQAQHQDPILCSPCAPEPQAHPSPARASPAGPGAGSGSGSAKRRARPARPLSDIPPLPLVDEGQDLRDSFNGSSHRSLNHSFGDSFKSQEGGGGSVGRGLDQLGLLDGARGRRDRGGGGGGSRDGASQCSGASRGSRDGSQGGSRGSGSRGGGGGRRPPPRGSQSWSGPYSARESKGGTVVGIDGRPAKPAPPPPRAGRSSSDSGR